MFSVFVDNILLLTHCAPPNLMLASGFDVHSRALIRVVLQASQVKTVDDFSVNTFLLQPCCSVC